MNNCEDMHLCRLPEQSKRVADLFQRAGIPFHERINTEIGVEYVISVPSEESERAIALFWQYVGPGQTFASTGGSDDPHS